MIATENFRALPFWYRLLSVTSFAASGVIIAIGIYLILPSMAEISIWPSVLAGGSLYLLSQSLRGLRLAIIVGDPGKSLRQLLQAHLIGASASFCLPYKAGDLFRLIELAFVLRREKQVGLWRSILVMWIERVYDALLIAVLLLFLGLTAGEGSVYLVLPVLAALSAFIAATLVIFFILPENLDSFALFLARRYHGSQVVHILRYIDRLYRLTADAKRMLHRKHVTLIAVSTLLWISEVVVVAMIFGNGSLGSSAITLLRFLSGILSPTFMQGSGELNTYSVAIGVPLLVCGLISWLASFLGGRLKMATTLWSGRRLILQRTQ